MEAERHEVGDGHFSLRGTDLEAGTPGRVTKSEPFAPALQVSRAELLICNPGNSDQLFSGAPRSLGPISILTDWFYLPSWLDVQELTGLKGLKEAWLHFQN